MYYLVLLVLLAFGCSKEENSDDLFGKWTFGSCFVNGQKTAANGELNFVEGAPCSVDIWYEILQDSIVNDTVFLQGEFDYQVNDDLLTINLDSETLYWDRVVNTKEEQEFHFQKIIREVQFDIVFNLVRD